MPGACEELYNDATPHEIYYSGVGLMMDDGSDEELQIDLRITNTTEYRAVAKS